MGSKVWFKNIIKKKKVKKDKSHKLKSFASPEKSDDSIITEEKECPELPKCDSKKNYGTVSLAFAATAATRIQAAYRGYMARKIFRRLKAIVRLQNLVQCDSVKKQASNTLSHLHSWSRIQAQIKTRRVNMVNESRLKQKKLDNQMKLEAKINGLEVDWSGGTKSKDEARAKIHQREEAAAKRERAMAYAFTHQWRANSNPNFGSVNNELSQENGWSWTDRWVAARPWENRAIEIESPKKMQTRPPIKTRKKIISPPSKMQRDKITPKKIISPPSKMPIKEKLNSPKGKAPRKSPRKLVYEVPKTAAARKTKVKAEEETKEEREGS